MKRRSWLSIRSKMVLAMSALVACISVGIYLYFPSRLERQEFGAISEKARSISRMTAYSLTPALLFEDFRGAEETVTSACQNSDVKYLIVIDDSGHTLVAHNPGGIVPETFGKRGEDNLVSADRTLYETVTPVTRNGAPLGTVYLGIDLGNLNRETTQSRRAVALLSLLILGAGVLLSVIISTAMTKPLSRMVKIVEKIGEGDWSQRTRIGSGDEVGRLGIQFDRMIDNLELSRRRLEESNRTLEENVRERTKQLQWEIGEHELTEGRLRQTSSQLRAVFDAVPDAFLHFSAGGLLLNSLIGQRAGFHLTLDEKAERTIRTIFPGSVSARLEEAMTRARVSGLVTIAEYDALRDGHLQNFEVRFVPIGDDQAIAIVRDMTEQRDAEKRIRELAALLDVTRDAIRVQSLDHVILYWNNGARNIYGWNEDEFRSDRVVDFLVPSGEEGRYEEALAAVTGSGTWAGEMRQKTKSGQIITTEERWTLMRNFAGRRESILVVSTDITEKKLLESQYSRAQRMEIVGTLAGGIAHDLNNVLTPILLAIQLLDGRARDSQERSWISTIQASANRGAEIIKQVLTFSRGVEGERVILQPRHLLKEIHSIITETFPREIEIGKDFEKNLWTVSGDATQLHQMMMNLLVNARDAMPKGGTLRLLASNVEISRSQIPMGFDAQPGSFVCISIADTGIGIPHENLSTIFEPFFTTKEIGKGTGLGLSNVLGIVRSHKGFVIVESQVGKGSKFSLYLPASKSALQQSANVQAGRDLSGSGETILIVDDESYMREIMEEILSTSGYQVLTARDGIEGLAIFESNIGRIDGVITDIMMPKMDGITLVVRLLELTSSVKLIVTSGLADSAKLTALRKLRIHAFLPKPFSGSKLLETLQEVLSKAS
jgi:two-component system, cell cycle sensor histidine kinase and response regulator CckA